MILSKLQNKNTKFSMFDALFSSGLPSGRRKVVILGSGWAGYSLARRLNKKICEVTMVSPRNHFLFTPLLSTTTVGTLEFRNIIESARRIKNIKYIQASCKSVDADSRTIECANKNVPDTKISVKFDDLVIACGAEANTFNIDGAKENSYFLKQLSDARRIRNRLSEIFEMACIPNLDDDTKRKLLTIVIVGAGPANIEFAAELYDFVKRDAHRLFPGFEKYLNIHIIEAAKTILPMFKEHLKEHTIKEINKRNIKIHYETFVRKVEKDKVVLSSGREICSGMIVWSTGNKMIPFIEKLDFKKNERNKSLMINDKNNVMSKDGKSYTNIFALGDCAFNPNSPLPPTAQVAQQQAYWLCKEMNKMKNRKDFEPFKYVHKGTMAYIGGKDALVDTKYGSFSGISGWLFWNSVYLSKQFSLKNKISVPVHWGINHLLGRNMCQF